MSTFKVKAFNKLAYGVGKLLELPYDLIKNLRGLADRMPELNAEILSGAAWTYKKKSNLGYLVKGIANLILNPIQWIVGGVYYLVGLRFLTNFLRESSDILILNDLNKVNSTGKERTLEFLQLQRRKNNSGRGAFTYKEGPIETHEGARKDVNTELHGSSSQSAGWTGLERRIHVDDCIDELLADKSSYSKLVPFLTARLERTQTKLKALSNTEIDHPEVLSPRYAQCPTNFLFMKSIETPKQRKLRLVNNEASLKEMLEVTLHR